MKPPLVLLGIGAACAACCAPLLLPMIGGTTLAVFLAALSLDTLLCGMIGLVFFGVAGYWLYRRRTKARQTTCDCRALVRCRAVLITPMVQVDVVTTRAKCDGNAPCCSIGCVK
jgi:membrane protein implicated in regulation of membrane protease activity